MPTSLTRVLFPIAAMLLLGACGKATPANGLQGDWTVDMDATLARAASDGLSARLAPQIRSIYNGGTLRITQGELVMGLAGSHETKSLAYTLVGTSGDCYRLTVTSNPGTHEYCVTQDRLEVHDPGAHLVVVFARD
jgi:hypothetical protein